MESSVHARKEDMVLCLMELNEDGDKGTEDWTNLLDRGGLWHVSDTTYSIFYAMEEEIRTYFTLKGASKIKEGSKDALVNCLMMKFFFCGACFLWGLRMMMGSNYWT